MQSTTTCPRCYVLNLLLSFSGFFCTFFLNLLIYAWPSTDDGILCRIFLHYLASCFGDIIQNIHGHLQPPKFSHALLEGVSVYAATGVCEHFLLLSVHSRKHVLRKSKSSLRKMDSKVLKRGQPKGAEQTVIGLPAKWKCFTKPVVFCKKDPLKKTESKKKHLVCCQPGIVYNLDYIVCKSKGNFLYSAVSSL